MDTKFVVIIQCDIADSCILAPKKNSISVRSLELRA